MVNYIKVSKDLGQIKKKFIAGLTKRQTICFALGFIIGFPVYFITKSICGNLSVSLVFMIISAAPALFCGLYNKNGLYFEQVIKNIICFKKRGSTLTYQSENPYKQISDEIEMQKIKQILKKNGVVIHKKKKGVKNFGNKK